MDRLEQRIAAASRHLDVALDSHALADLEAKTFRRATHKIRRRKAMALGSVSALLAIVMVFLYPRFPTEPAPESMNRGGQILTFVDGSTANLDPGARLETPGIDRPDRIELNLDDGVAQFVVTPRPNRKFRVRAGDLIVEVLGTAFTVTNNSTEATVTVDRGRVQVLRRHPSGTELPLSQLTAGQAATFAHIKPLPSAVLPPEPVPAPREVRVITPAAPRSSWRTLARRGEVDQAFKALRRAGPADVRDVPEDLLSAADVARLSGHPQEAVAPLEQMLARHADDARAGLAAFTLGRLYLSDLSDPRRAALAFETARHLSPSSPLLADAWGHEAEAWARAHMPDRAANAAREYLRLRPTGPREGRMRSLAGSANPAIPVRP